jgi:hypothetical protein
MKNEASPVKSVPRSYFYILMGIIGAGVIAVILRMAGII